MNGRDQKEDDLPFSSQTMQVISASDTEISRDHGERELRTRRQARIWRHANLQGIELFHGSYRSYRFAKHFHRIPAIGFVDRGSMSSYCRGENHILASGTLLLLNPGEIHAPAPADSASWSFRMVYLDERVFRSLSLDFNSHDFRFRQPFARDGALVNCLSQLHQELEQNGDRLRFESCLCNIFSRLATFHCETSYRRFKRKSAKTGIEKALEYLSAYYHRNLSLAELADLSPFSASHFLRVFRDTVGLTPHSYLTQLRVEAAASLLREGMALSDTAGVVGFVDQSHLTRNFKKILGVTPGQFRVPSKGALALKPRRISA